MKIKLRSWSILALFINILISSYDPLEAMEVNKPTVAASPFKSSAKRHKGLVQQGEEEYDVLVKPCISLGQSCTAEVSKLINEADEFVVSFMYRMNSPNIINSLANKSNQIPVVTFLDYAQSIGNSAYHQYVKRLIDIVPTSLVKLGSVSFHHKVVISKKQGQEAIVVIGSAKSTFESENVHSEDMVFIQSNKLANILLNQYHKLFTMKVSEKEQTVKIYHEHRLNKGESNTEKLQEFRSKLLGTDTSSLLEEYTKASITALALSTGFASTGGSKRCFEILENIFNAENQALFLFENFFTLKAAINLANKSDAAKLIILDRDRNNESILPLLRKQPKNMVGMFTPYTLGKFHHKLIIQYLYEGDPILYTGSFHPSESAVANNSELIIGIKSVELPFQYLASIMEQSGLIEDLTVWQFFRKLANPELILANQTMKAVIDKTYGRILHKMNAYLEKYQRIFDNLSSINRELPIENLEMQFANFDHLSTDDQLEQLYEWNKLINTSVFKPYYQSILKEKLKNLAKVLEIPPLAEDAYWTRYLMNMGEWIIQAKEQLKKTRKGLMSLKAKPEKGEQADEGEEEAESEEETAFSKEDFKKIYSEIIEIEMLYLLLKDAHSYPEEFKEMRQLTKVLSEAYP